MRTRLFPAAILAFLACATGAWAQTPTVRFATTANVKGRAFENQSPLAVPVQLSFPTR